MLNKKISKLIVGIVASMFLAIPYSKSVLALELNINDGIQSKITQDIFPDTVFPDVSTVVPNPGITDDIWGDVTQTGTIKNLRNTSNVDVLGTNSIRLNASGTVSTNSATVTTDVDYTIRDSYGNTVVQSYDALSFSRAVSGSSFSFSESFTIGSLNAGTRYIIDVYMTSYDEKGNSVKSDRSISFTTHSNSSNNSTSNSTSLSTSISGISSDMATLNIYHGYNNNVSYNLYFKATAANDSSNYVSIDNITPRDTSYTLRNLTPNTIYNYTLVDRNNRTVSNGSFTTSNVPSNNNNNSTSSDVITSSDISKSDIKDTSAELYIGNSDLYNRIKNGREFSSNISGSKVSFNGSRLVIDNLIPGKQYTGVVVTFIDEKGTQRRVTVPNFSTRTSDNKVKQFVVDVYRHAFNRTPDESGYLYWENNLRNRSITPEKFVLNLLSEKEFIQKYTTTTQKIGALYQVILNRTSDAEGLKFWTEKYDSLVREGMNESQALESVSGGMVSSSEFVARVNALNI